MSTQRTPQIGDRIRFTSRTHGETVGTVTAIDRGYHGKFYVQIPNVPETWKVFPGSVLEIVPPFTSEQAAALGLTRAAPVTVEPPFQPWPYLLRLLEAGTIYDDFGGVVR